MEGGYEVVDRARLCWMDSMNMTLGSRGMAMKAARQCAKDRKEWEALVPTRSFLLGLCVPTDRPPVLWWLSPEEGWNAVT